MLDSSPQEQVTVEAETVEAALAQISGEFGENAEIVRAQKVHRGGVGGFFAKEMVQLTVRRRREEPPPLRSHSPGAGITDVLERMAQDADAEDSDFRTVLRRELGAGEAATSSAGFLAAAGREDADEPVAGEPTASEEPIAVAPAKDNGVPEPVAVGPLLRQVPEPVDLEDESSPDVAVDADTETPIAGPVVPLPEASETDFEEAAEIELAAEAAVPELQIVDGNESSDRNVATDPVADPHWWRTAQSVDAPAGMGPVSWSTTSLLRLGLPGPVISEVADLDPSDDLGWIESIAAVVAPHCGPLPEDDVIVVGPHAERLAEPLGLPLVRSGDMAPYDGSFCAMVEDSAEDRRWLEFVRGGRGIHLVVGDEPWQDLLIDEPVAVSWVGETAVADALYLAFTLGATLAFGTVDGFVSTMVRAQPADVALAIRRIVGRQ